MGIHHTQQRKAEKLGFTLEEAGELVRAFWPKRALAIYGVSGTEAIAQMQNAMKIIETNPDLKIRPVKDNERFVQIELNGQWLADGPYTAGEALRALDDEPLSWVEPTLDDEPEPTGDTADTIEDTFEPAIPAIERINGVPTDGAVAYREGIPSGDCPYSSEDEDQYDDFERWNTEWDDAADAAEEEKEEGAGGSVVASKYRIKYAELGHPNHCGDWLAEVLNNFCVGDKQTDLETFEAICQRNGVDTSKYKRSGTGWQGRIRMTGRNLLAKKVYINDGKIEVPTYDDGTGWATLQAPADWMAAQRYSMPKKKEDKVAEQTAA